MRKSNKKNAAKKTPVKPTTEATQAPPDSGGAANVTTSDETKSADEIQKEVDQIMQPFTSEKETSDDDGDPGQAVNDETTTTEDADDEFIPKRERKKRESKKEKETKEREFKLPGRLVNRMTNRMVGGLTLWIDGIVNKKDPIPAEYVYLSEEEINDEDNVQMAEEFIKALNLTKNPIVMYLGIMTGSILANYITMRTLMKQARRQNPDVNFHAPKPEQDDTKK